MFMYINKLNPPCLTWTHWPNISSDPSLQWVTPSHSWEMKAACSPRTE